MPNTLWSFLGSYSQLLWNCLHVYFHWKNEGVEPERHLEKHWGSQRWLPGFKRRDFHIVHVPSRHAKSHLLSEPAQQDTSLLSDSEGIFGVPCIAIGLFRLDQTIRRWNWNQCSRIRKPGLTLLGLRICLSPHFLSNCLPWVPWPLLAGDGFTAIHFQAIRKHREQCTPSWASTYPIKIYTSVFIPQV